MRTQWVPVEGLQIQAPARAREPPHAGAPQAQSFGQGVVALIYESARGRDGLQDKHGFGREAR